MEATMNNTPYIGSVLDDVIQTCTLTQGIKIICNSDEDDRSEAAAELAWTVIARLDKIEADLKAIRSAEIAGRNGAKEAA